MRTTSFLISLAAAAGLSLLAACSDNPAVPESALPPGQPIALANASFNGDAQGRIGDWLAVEHNVGKSYTFVADTAQPRSAPSSARIQRYGPEIYGVLEQRLVAKPEWRGKTVRLSGYLRSAGINGTGGALVMQAIDGSGSVLAHDHMDGRRVLGDTPWRQYSVQLKLPPTTWFVQVGVMLEEGGTLWADDLALDIMD